MGRILSQVGNPGAGEVAGGRRVWGLLSRPGRHRFLALLAGAALALAAVPAGALMLQSWQELSPEQRRRALENYEIFRGLDPGRREDVEKNYQKWRALPEPEREKLRQNFERYREMSPQERQEFDRRYRQWRRNR